MMGDYEDVLAAAAAAAALEDRIGALHASPPPNAGGVPARPLSVPRDHVEGPESAPLELVVFGAYGAPESSALGRLLGRLRAAHPAALRVAWRHRPDRDAHPYATALALAAEAAATEGRFWSMNRELLGLRHYDLRGVQHAARRADVDFDRLLSLTRADVAADRVVDDVASALGRRRLDHGRQRQRFNGGGDAEAIWAAIDASGRQALSRPA